MSVDGTFIHFLTIELREILEGKRIRLFSKINNSDFLIAFQNNINVFVSLNNIAHIRITTSTLSTSTPDTFTNATKRIIESSIVTKIHQYQNDRIIVFDLLKQDELGYQHKFNLIIELFGRHSNLIITNAKYEVIDCFKKSTLDNLNKRIIHPKVVYTFPETVSIDPFENKSQDIYLEYQGISKTLLNEIFFRKNMDFIYHEFSPCIVKCENKTYFHVFNLKYLDGEKTFFNKLSPMLEYYFETVKNETIQSNDFRAISIICNKEIVKIRKKIEKQKNELKNALENMIYEKFGNLIISNLHNIPENAENIIVFDYYENKDIEVKLDKTISVINNSKNFFKLYKKAKRTIPMLKSLIKTAENQILYYEEILLQIKLGKRIDLKEILHEIRPDKKTLKNLNKKIKPNFGMYSDFDDNKYYVGKNNIQNTYLSSKIAKKNDYFFHVKNYSGSHTILKGDLNEKSIYLAASLAAYFSSLKNSKNVAVDYTEMKYVKKIPHIKGSFVTYSQEKTIFITPDYDEIKKLTK